MCSPNICVWQIKKWEFYLLRGDAAFLKQASMLIWHHKPQATWLCTIFSNIEYREVNLWQLNEREFYPLQGDLGLLKQATMVELPLPPWESPFRRVGLRRESVAALCQKGLFLLLGTFTDPGGFYQSSVGVMIDQRKTVTCFCQFVKKLPFLGFEELFEVKV